jgi:mRNA interferase MazF
LTPLYVVAMVTSRVAGPPFAHDVLVEEWQKAGLPKPSLIRLAKLVTVEETLIRRRLGRLANADAARVRTEGRRLFSTLLA